MRIPQKKPRRRFKRRTAVFLAAILMIVGLGYNYLRPLPSVAATEPTQTLNQSAVQLAWPAYGEAAIGAVGYGVLASHGGSRQIPTASLAKTITALGVLQRYPLNLGDQGPEITITNADVALYNSYYAKGGSTARVVAGEQISEYQALQALMLPSANNMADTLAVWAFGSMDAYHAYANNMLQQMGLNSTHTAVDASGFSPQTVSTASDLVKLGAAAMQNKVLARIVAQPTADIPVAGTIRNANWLLNTDGVVGLKTGNTDQAGGCFLFAATQTLDGHTVTIVGAIMAAPTLHQSIADARPLLASAKQNFSVTSVVQAGQLFGTYSTPWSQTAQAIAGQDLRAIAWKGAAPSLQTSLGDISHAQPAGSQVGTVSTISGDGQVSIPIVLQQDISGPGFWWRLTRFR